MKKFLTTICLLFIVIYYPSYSPRYSPNYHSYNVPNQVPSYGYNYGYGYPGSIYGHGYYGWKQHTYPHLIYPRPQPPQRIYPPGHRVRPFRPLASQR